VCLWRIEADKPHVRLSAEYPDCVAVDHMNVARLNWRGDSKAG
jgi:hypothetical protein